MATKTKTREEWLTQALRLVSAHLEKTAGIKVPTGTRVSVSLPTVRARVGALEPDGRGGVTGRGTVGECRYATAARAPSIGIPPAISDPVKVLDILVHEAIHAALGPGHGHGAAFQQAASAAGLAGKPTATVASDELRATLVKWSGRLGTFTHAAERDGRVKQGTRMLKVVCPVEHGEGKHPHYTVRMTAKWLEEMGAPTCPCGRKMKEA